MLMQALFALAATGVLAMVVAATSQTGSDASLRSAVSFYASFDQAPRGDVGDGDLNLWTRSEHETVKGQHDHAHGFDAKLVRVAPGKGVHGGALELTGDLPRNGILYFPARGKLAWRRGGWGGAFSIWVRPSPQTPFCDIVYITQKRWNDGGIWFDFNHDKVRDLRLGTFPAVAEGQVPPKETDAGIPMIRIAKDALRFDEWNHVALTWENFDSGRADGQARLYIDGKLAAAVKDRNLAMAWDLEQTRIFLGFKFLGLLDEFALFKRALTEEEVTTLFRKPDVLAGLKEK